MNIYTELLLVTCVVTYIVDLSGWTDTWLRWLGRALHRTVRAFRPFSCAQCMTWWCCLLWALLRGSLSLPVVAASAGFAFCSITLSQSLIFIREAALWLLRLISRWIQD